MTSQRHLVARDLLRLVDRPTEDVTLENLAERRAAFSATMRAMEPVPQDQSVELTERHVPGSPGGPDVRVLLFRPETPPARCPAAVFIHGGGFVSGDPDMYEWRSRQIARDIPCLVMAVDYRLAPETPHPGPIEDCYAALKWLHGAADDLGIDRDAIVVFGESAGGGLVAALALLARDRGEIPIRHQFLLSPILDDRVCLDPDPHPFTGEFGWTPSRNLFGWRSLLGGEPGGAHVSPYAAPARADDLAGLPPAFISVGALDLLLQESLDYARRLTRAGVPVELHVYPGAVHSYPLAPESRTAQVALRDFLEALTQALEPSERAASG